MGGEGVGLLFSLSALNGQTNFLFSGKQEESPHSVKR
jgi:hypothetical protein